jgi:hypothetical protein
MPHPVNVFGAMLPIGIEGADELRPRSKTKRNAGLQGAALP